VPRDPLNSLLSTALDAAEAAAAVQRRDAPRAAEGVREKGRADWVSQTDLDAQEAALAIIRGRHPDHAILAEESDETVEARLERWDGRPLWLVDPLDGTANFLFGLPQWAVSIAVEDGDGVLAGVVYDPPRGELWAAERGGAAMLDGRPVRGSRRGDLATALVATGFGYDAGVRRAQAATIAALLPEVRDVRRFGAAALDLAWCAAGRFDAYYERGVHRWDVAAGGLLCECAGLVVEPLAAAPPQGTGLLVSAPGIADALRDRVA
jgi:myo-inositol-1(or 4)-monophosphatase